MDFQVLQNEKVVGRVSKEWFSWGDSYQVQIWNEELETIMVALVIAIDFVKARQEAAAASAT